MLSKSQFLLVLPALAGCAQGTAERGEPPVNNNNGDVGNTVITMLPPLPDEAPAGSPVAKWGQLRVEGTNLVSETGSPVQLRGPSTMWLNWETKYSRSFDTLEYLKNDWHASVVRAAMGIEPSGAYLESPVTAKAAVRLVIDNAIRLGLYVIVDWHAHHAEEHTAQAIEFFQEIAAEYGERPNILYEVFNEPDGDREHPVDWPTIKAYHEQLVPAIRAEDPDNVIILGTTAWSQGVDDAANDPVSGSQLMYTLHFYSCSHTAWLRDNADSALELGLPIFVTEWGASHSDGGTPENPDLCLEEAGLWVDWMKEHQISWTAWKLDDCEDVTCYFQPGTAATGTYTDDQLNGHASFVRDSMR